MTKLHVVLIVSFRLKGIVVKTEFQINQVLRRLVLEDQSCLSLTAYFAKPLVRKYYKEGASVVTKFLFPTQRKRENTKKSKKYIFIRNPKMITMRRGCRSAHKIVRNWLRRFKNTKFEI